MDTDNRVKLKRPKIDLELLSPQVVPLDKFKRLREKIVRLRAELDAAETELRIGIETCDHEPIVGVLPAKMVDAMRRVFGSRFLKGFNKGPVCRLCGYAGEDGGGMGGSDY